MKTFCKKIFVFLLLVSGAAAQDSQLKIVGEPKIMEGELIGKEVRDANGEVCAGLIIFSDLKGLAYQSNDGIVKVNSDPGKDFLFLSPGEKVVDVFCTGYKPLKIILTEVGIRLKSGQVWAITLEGEKFVPVSFIITPRDAKLTVDNKPTDLTKQPQLKIGKHVIKISKQGYETIVDTITVTESSTLFPYNLKEKVGAAKRDVPDFSIPLEKTYGLSALVANFTSIAGGVVAYELTNARNTFLGALIQAGKYDVINASEEDIQSTQNRVVTGSLSEREIAKRIGDAKKAGIVFSAVLNRTGSKYLMTINMYDVATSSIVATQSITYEGYLDDMTPLIEEAAQKIIGVYEEPSYTWYYVGGALLVGGGAAAILLQPEKVVPPVIDNSLPLPPDKPSN